MLTKKYHPITIAVICIHGDTRDYQIAWVEGDTLGGSAIHSVRVVPSLVYEAILGSNFLNFWKVWEKIQMDKERTAPTGEPDLSPDPFWESSLGRNCQYNIWGWELFLLSVMAGDQKEEETGTECVNVSQEVIPDLSVSGDNFGTEQLKDPILIRARENVMIDGVPVDPH